MEGNEWISNAIARRKFPQRWVPTPFLSIPINPMYAFDKCWLPMSAVYIFIFPTVIVSISLLLHQGSWLLRRSSQVQAWDRGGGRCRSQWHGRRLINVSRPYSGGFRRACIKSHMNVLAIVSVYRITWLEIDISYMCNDVSLYILLPLSGPPSNARARWDVACALG